MPKEPTPRPRGGTRARRQLLVLNLAWPAAWPVLRGASALAFQPHYSGFELKTVRTERGTRLRFQPEIANFMKDDIRAHETASP